MQDGEAGGITQQIGATYVPGDNLRQRTQRLQKREDFALKLPGLLIIDTPGAPGCFLPSYSNRHLWSFLQLSRLDGSRACRCCRESAAAWLSASSAMSSSVQKCAAGHLVFT